MRILDITITHFRGIERFYYQFSETDNFICIIGKNDSGKTTILKAIEWLFSPLNTLTVSASDFNKNDTSRNIVIEATFTDFPEDFILPDKYGRYLTEPGEKRQPEPPSAQYEGNLKIENTADIIVGGRNRKEIDTYREPENPGRLCLRAKLSISETIDPEWSIVSDAQEPTVFKVSDRRKLAVSAVGIECRKDLSWGQSSILRRYYVGDNIRSALKQLSTKAMQSISMKDDPESVAFNNSLSELPQIFTKFGLSLSGELSNQLDLRNADSSITLYEGPVSLASRGLGSQRLASIALNLESKENGALVLIDEIETSLEPFRIRNLVYQLRNRVEKNGQVFFTTHSPVVLDSCKPNEIYLMQSFSDKKKLFSLNLACDAEDRNKLEIFFRTNKKSLLARKIIVCEGMTEIGLVKSIEEYYLHREDTNLAYYGVDYVNAGGENNIPRIIRMLKKLGYIICVFMDADKPEPLKDVVELNQEDSSILVLTPNDKKCIEQQIFIDAPDAFIDGLCTYLEEYSLVDRAVISTLKNAIESKRDRVLLGNLVNQHAVFKKYGNAEILFPLLLATFEQHCKTRFELNVSKFIKWVKDEDSLY